MFGSGYSKSTGNTTHKVVLPFYIYAALSLLASTILLFFSSGAFSEHYFHAHTLAITHLVALGWGTMIILGASHQLVPVLIEKELWSSRLAFVSFILAAAGIPLLVYGFYVFNMGWPAKWGGRFLLLAVICYFVNLVFSMRNSGKVNVHAVFILTASLWLLFTVLLGLGLVYNFTFSFLPKESLQYLPLHAHAGIVGWFLLLILGVGSRLIPMFLISKYKNEKLLWWTYVLINAGLISFLLSFLYFPAKNWYYLSIGMIITALLMFGYYCLMAMRERIRKQVDDQMKTSLLSLLMMLIPLIFLLSIIGWLLTDQVNKKMVLIYGFAIFFGWITALIFGMTFKTLPFIVWNKVYHDLAGRGKIPNPKDLFNNKWFIIMIIIYLAGFVLFITGIFLSDQFLLNVAASILIAAAVIYNLNVFKVITHKPRFIDQH